MKQVLIWKNQFEPKEKKKRAYSDNQILSDGLLVFFVLGIRGTLTLSEHQCKPKINGLVLFMTVNYTSKE